MSETCLSNGKLAGVIFGAILGTLLICAVFIVLLWQWFKKHQNDSKIFYVERSEKRASKDVESGGESTGNNCVDQLQRAEESLKKKSDAHLDASQLNQRPITQQSIVLNDKRYSAANMPQPNQLTNNPPKVLPNLGVTITKMPRSGFQITSVEKVESRFLPSDLVTELSISLDQMSLEDAAKLLELLVPYRIQLEVLRSNSELDSASNYFQPVENGYNIMNRENTAFKDASDEEVSKTSQPDEKFKDENSVIQDEIDEVKETPRLPSVSPPTSPLPISVESQLPTNLSLPSNDNQDSKMLSDEDQQILTSVRSARHATRIPTPKSIRNSSRTALDTAKEQNDSDAFNKTDNQKINNCSYSTQSDVLTVSNEETDEFGLTSEQYETLENNRRRLERERQSLRDMGILS